MYNRPSIFGAKNKQKRGPLSKGKYCHSQLHFVLICSAWIV